MPHGNLPHHFPLRKSRLFILWAILVTLVAAGPGDQLAQARCQVAPELAALDQIRIGYKEAIQKRQEIYRKQIENQRMMQYTIHEVRALNRAMERADGIQVLMSMNLYRAAAQVSQRRYIELVQKAARLDTEFKKWQTAWPDFMERYWAHSDLERTLDRQQIEDRLKILATADPEDSPATITYVLLIERLGRFNEGLARIETVISMHTSLDAIALLAKSSLLRLSLRDNDARIAYYQADQMVKWLPEKLMPVFRFLRARLAASIGDSDLAHKEWQALTQIRTLELETHRGLALLHCNRVGSNGYSRYEVKEAVKQASIAMDLDPEPTWFSHFVMSMAYHAADQKVQAIEQVQEAKQKSKEDSLALCVQLEKSIQNGKVFRWDFRNVLNR